HFFHPLASFGQAAAAFLLLVSQFKVVALYILCGAYCHDLEVKVAFDRSLIDIYAPNPFNPWTCFCILPMTFFQMGTTAVS
ncbi:hypothetical protein, partial [Klebsiella pneumoniae]|uniref:hypothetical protein n=1 Tax=Klebsiella pneumoniae TaxID=573 RepID=UPI003B5AEBBE